MFSTTLLEMSWGRVRRRFTGPFYVSCPWSLLDRFVRLVWISSITFVLFPLESIYFNAPHKLDMINGADVFICWFNDCLSNITWNKTLSETDLLSVVVSQTVSLTLPFAVSKVTRTTVANVYQSRRILPQDQQNKAFVEETNHIRPKKSTYYNSAWNTIS